MRTRLRMLLGAILLASVGGCVEADLGDAPVFCNAWEPRCPEGYSCVLREREEVCVRSGEAALACGAEHATCDSVHGGQALQVGADGSVAAASDGE